MSVTSSRPSLKRALARLSGARGTPEKKTGPDDHNPSSVGRLLAKRMARAKRSGSWFRLSQLERGLFSLAIKTKARFESVSLVRAIVSVLQKLKEYSDPLYIFLVRGLEMASAFSDAATKWGHPGAETWKRDKSYATFLGRFLSSASKYV